MCAKRKKELAQNCVINDQFGYWLKARNRKTKWMGNKGSGTGKESNVQMRV